MDNRAMDEWAYRWMLMTVYKSWWRVSTWIKLDDLIQDGYLHYQRVLQHYPEVQDRAHLMRLFQRTLTGYLHDLATKRTKEMEGLAELAHQQAQNTGDYSGFLTAIALASPELRKLLSNLGDDTSAEILRRPYPWLNGHRETVNERLCRIAGISPSTNLVKQLRELLQYGDNKSTA